MWGFGGDFDGLEEEEKLADLKEIHQIQNLIEELQKIGFHENEIDKIVGQNWIRILKGVF